MGNVVEKAGIRVDPKDHIGFSNALDRLIKDEKLRFQLGKKARKIAVNEYSKEKVLKRFENLIIKLND